MKLPLPVDGVFIVDHWTPTPSRQNEITYSKRHILQQHEKKRHMSQIHVKNYTGPNIICHLKLYIIIYYAISCTECIPDKLSEEAMNPNTIGNKLETQIL